jgi:RNA polymerase primary sigma factor
MNTTVHSMLQKVNKARKDMIHEVGRVPSVPELAHYMEMSIEELTRLTSRSRNVVSLELPLRSGGSLKEDTRTIGDMMVSDAPTPEEDAQNQYLKEDIRAVINELKTRERDVLILRFGLDNGNPMSISETAKRLAISSDRVRLVEARALNKLRSPQRNYRLKEYIGGQNEEDQPAEEPEPSPEKMWFF